MDDGTLKLWSNCIFAYDDLKCRFCGIAHCEKCKYHITKSQVVNYLCNVTSDNYLPLQVINDLTKQG